MFLRVVRLMVTNVDRAVGSSCETCFDVGSKFSLVQRNLDPVRGYTRLGLLGLLGKDRLKRSVVGFHGP